MYRTLRIVLICAFLGVALSPLAVPTAATPQTYTIDANHDLATERAVERYDAEGYADADLQQLDMRLAVATDHEALNISGVHADSNYHYLHVDYNEEISRELRFYIPAGMWSPYRSEVTAIEDDSLTASLSPVANGSYTAVTLTVDGPTEATFKINRAQAGLLSGRSWVEKQVENLTGFAVPTLGGGSTPQWEYIQSSTLANDTQPIDYNDTKPRMQYNDPDAEGENWLTLPECDGSEHEVCYYRKTGDNETVYVRAGVADPPQVRYKQAASGVPNVDAILRGAGEAIETLIEDATGWIGVIRWT